MALVRSCDLPRQPDHCTLTSMDVRIVTFYSISYNSGLASVWAQINYAVFYP